MTATEPVGAAPAAESPIAADEPQPAPGATPPRTPLVARAAAELVGTAALVAVVVGSGIQATELTQDVALQLLANSTATVFGLGATQRVQSGGPRISDLGDIVAVPPVRSARDAGLIADHRMFESLTAGGARWADGGIWPCDAIIWCTGFRPALSHLSPLGLRTEGGRIPTEGTRAAADPRIHLLGYGDWTGPASATLIGVGRTARQTTREIAELLSP